MIVHVDLQPEHVELLQHFGDAHAGFGFEVEVQVQVDVNVGTDGVAEGADQVLDVTQDRRGDGAIGSARTWGEAAPVHRGRLARNDYVGLQGGEAFLHHFSTKVGDVFQGAQGRDSYQLMGSCPGSAAVGPVDPHAVPGGTAEQLRYGDAQRLGFNIHQSAVDAGDGFGCDAAGALAGSSNHVPEAHLEGQGVLADKDRGQVFYGGHDA